MVHRRLHRAATALCYLLLVKQGASFSLQPGEAAAVRNKPVLANHWHVFRAADHLENEGLSVVVEGQFASTADHGARSKRRDDLTRQTVDILRRWGDEWAGQREMQSLLNKPELLHEIEESIVALTPFCDWLDDSMQKGMKPITLVDVCAGKGILSMLASYILRDDAARVKQIVMLDKAALNWDHILAANEGAEREDRPPIITWPKCNLHEIEKRMLMNRWTYFEDLLRRCRVFVAAKWVTSKKIARRNKLQGNHRLFFHRSSTSTSRQ